MASRVSHDDDEDDKDWLFRSRKLPDPKLLSNHTLDHRGPSTTQSQRPGYQAHSSQEAGSSGAIINATYVPPRPIASSTKDSILLTQANASGRPEEGQTGMKRLHTPTVQLPSPSGLDSAGATHAHNLPQGPSVEWPNKIEIQAHLSAGSSHYTRSDYVNLKTPSLDFDYDIEVADRVRHVKRSRRVQMSVITPTIETRELEEQCEWSHRFGVLLSGSCILVTSALVRPNGKAGNEIPEQFLDLSTNRRNLYNGLVARFGLDLNATADLQNILEFFDDVVPGPGHRERRNIRLPGRTSPRSFAPSTPYLPPSLPLGCNSLIYLSEVLPRSLDQRKRLELLTVFRTKAPYVPACINLASGLNYGIQYHVRKLPRLAIVQPDLPLGLNQQGWPSNSLPLEIFNIISNHLPRDALQSMRLVNREFESKISNALFHTVVVPFRPEIYGMMVQQGSSQDSILMDVKGKGREPPKEPEKRVYDGMRTFQGWGPHIKRFAMAFEVEENTLEKPPPKGKYETHGTFWGCYRWPHPNYNRYEYCEDLEKKADEFRCMSAALSNLTGVTELGLSIDSGLGWLNGPDISDRARTLREKPRIFGKSQRLPDTSTQQRQNEWNQEVKSILGSSKEPGLPVRNGFYEATVYWPSAVSCGSSRRPLFDCIPERSIAPESLSRPLIFGGVNIRRPTPPMVSEERSNGTKLMGFSKAPLISNFLSSSQQEWLLEIEWAQRAFFSSFCMALSDNSAAFSRVTTLNITWISSRHLVSLQRRDFWKALHNLSDLTIHVSADWRNILKTATGAVEAPAITPSTAANQFYDLLKNHISGMRNIKNLAIGYVGGGEHQTGIYGRNKNVLPAPVVDFAKLTLSSWTTRGEHERSLASNMLKDLLILQHVEKLTLTNCWFPPLMFKVFCTRMRLQKLKRLTLTSVSLCFQSTIRSSQQPQNTEPDVSSVPQGPPRYGDPSVANFFHLRPGGIENPQPDGWVRTPQRIGSWGQVIDFVTPGANLDFARYAYQYYDKEYFESLRRPDTHALESITFVSCGYVRLSNFLEFQQDILERDQHAVPAYLGQRATDLARVSMDNSCDRFLGEIVTTFPPKETEVLETGFPMVFGWADKEKAADCLEDGQPLGGSGRFSGKVQRLTYPVISDHEPTRIYGRFG